MAGIGRFSRAVPNLTSGEWDDKKRRDLEEFLRGLFKGSSAMMGTPPDPVEIQAGVTAAPGSDIHPANAAHVHAIETAAPSLPVAYDSTVADEGTGTALMRADAQLVLEDGDNPGDTLVWNGTVWVSTPAGGGGGTWTEVEIDFGSTPVYEATFTITDAAITSSAVKVILVPCGKAATGRTADDWQWDGGTFAADPGTGSATCYAAFFPGPIVGKRKLQYTVA